VSDAFHASGYILRFAVHDARTLKDKRRVIKSLIDRMRNQTMLCIAETGALNRVNASEIGIVGCSNDGRHLQSMLDAAVGMSNDDPRLELIQQTPISLVTGEDMGTLEGWMERLHAAPDEPLLDDDDADADDDSGDAPQSASGRRRPARDD
jgi:uncharacterized protein YlxP (DUF503 family)